MLLKYILKYYVKMRHKFLNMRNLLLITLLLVILINLFNFELNIIEGNDSNDKLKKKSKTGNGKAKKGYMRTQGIMNKVDRSKI